MPFWSILTPGGSYFSTTIFPIEMELFAIQHSWDLRLQKQIQSLHALLLRGQGIWKA